MNQNKIFIVSLPRTGTTSACIYLLELGFQVAHTAFNDEVFKKADVVADTPVFSDYSDLLVRYPDAKFIYLERPKGDWVLSIRRLLTSMRKQWKRDQDALHNEIWRSFNSVFPEFYSMREYSDDYLLKCYSDHESSVIEALATDEDRFLCLDITHADAANVLKSFCLAGEGQAETEMDFPHVNMGRRITYWESVEHPNKVDSHFDGSISS